MRAFTLLEMLASVVIVLVLASMIYPAVHGITPAAERAVCTTNLRNLHTAFAGYAVEGWPQIPKGITLGSIQEQKWWRDTARQDLGLGDKAWECPTLKRSFRTFPEDERPLIHYLPTPFGPQPNLANKNSQMPWFIEMGDAHGGGNLIVRQNGTVEPSRP